MTSWLIKGADRILDLDADRKLLNAIALLDAELDSNPLDSDLEDVFEALQELADGGTHAQKVRTILLAKGLQPGDVEAIAATWRRLRARVTGLIPKQYRPLAMTLAMLKQPDAQRELEWAILDDGQEQSAALPLDPLQLRLEGEASLGASFEAYPDKLPKDLPDHLPRPQVRISARGKLRLGAGADLPVFKVGVRLEGKAETAVALDWYFYNKESASFAAALVRDLGRLRSPFELGVLDELLRAAGTDTPHLAALQVSVEAGLGFSGEIALAEPVSFLAAGMPAQASARIGFKARRSGALRYLIYPGQGGIVVSVQRVEADEQTRSASLKIALELGEHYQDLRRVLLAKLPEVSRLLARIESALPTSESLRGMLAEEVNQALAASPYAALLNAALGFNSEKSASEVLAETLLARLQTSTARWDEDAAAAAERLIERVFAQLGLSGTLVEGLRAKAIAAARKAIEAERQRLAGTIKDAVKGDGYKDLAETLDALGHRVDTTLSALGKRVDAVTGPILKELGRYQEQLDKLTQALEKATHAKLQARIHGTLGSLGETGLDAVLLFRGTDAPAQALFRHVLVGNLDKVFDTLRAQPEGGSVELLSGQLARHLKLSERTGYDLILLDMHFAGQRSFTADLEYVVDQSGNIRVQSRGEIEACRRGWKEGRCLEFVNVFALATASKSRSLGLSLTLSQEDEDLDPADVRGFYGSLEAGGLVRAGTAAQAMDLFRSLDDNDPRTLLKGRLEMGFLLDTQRVDSFLGLDANGNAVRSDAEILRLAVEELVPAGMKAGLFEYPLDRQRLERIRRDFPELDPPQPAEIAAAILNMTPEMAARADRSVGILRPNEYNTAQCTLCEDIRAVARYHEHARGIVEMANTLRDVYLSGGTPGLWSEADYQKAQQTLNDCLRFWLKVDSRWLVLLPEKVRPFTVAFLRILARLAGMPLGDADRSLLRTAFTASGKRYDLN